MTERDAAIHAARSLLHQRILVERDDELVEVPDAVASRPVAWFVPVDFEEASNLAHSLNVLRVKIDNLGGLCHFHFFQRSAVVDRHHFYELRLIEFPLLEDIVAK